MYAEEVIYVLATSKDINRLDKEFFDKNFTIGINQAYKRAEECGSQLTMWVCLDEFFKFYQWVRQDASHDTIKFVPAKYLADSRLGALWNGYMDCRIKLFQPWDMVGHKKFNCHFNAKGGLILDEMCYSIFTALSLAVLLGTKKIILRGVSLKGDYFDSAIFTSRDVYYDDIKRRFKKYAVPALRNMGIDIENQTYDTELEIEPQEKEDKPQDF